MNETTAQRIARKVLAELFSPMPSPSVLQDEVAEIIEAELQPDLELLIKIAAREQRYACVEALNRTHVRLADRAVAQNAPAPDTAKVLAAWRAAIQQSEAK